MKHSLLLGIAVTVGLGSTPLMAQRTVESAARIVPPTAASEATTRTPATGTPVSNSAAMPAPITLRSGAVPTGLSGYYDYQSNGVLRGRLYIPKNDPQRIYTTYMLSLNGSDENQIDPSRRVGYAFSTNGGNSWESTKEIDPGFRLGYPYMQVTADGTPYIATHGDPDNAGVRTMMYTGSAGTTNFTRTGTFDRLSFIGSAGDDGAGVIWPSFIINPSDPTKQIVAATLSYATEGGVAEPVHVATSALGGRASWSIINESETATSSGGRNIFAKTASGKVGMLYFHFDTVGTSGIYLTESTNGGTSWSTPEMLVARTHYLNEEDTLYIGANIDFVYNGEEPHVVTNGNIDGLFATQSIYYWNRAAGLKRLTGADSILGIGLNRAQLAKTQSNMDFVAYPTISLGDDGNHIVVTFSAAGQVIEDDQAVAITSADGFYYYRVWAIGSDDNGTTWHTPRILQDYTGGGGEDASIEYPLANDWGRVVDGSFEHSMVFQAKREPGMYASVVTDISGDPGDQPADAGPINEAFQYYQRTMLDPTFFGKPASVDRGVASNGGIMIERSYPNPTNSSFTVEYQLPAAGETSVKVFNALGSEVLTPVAAQMQYTGSYHKNFDVSSLPAGQYRVVITQNGRSVSQGMTIVR